jgi:hypothetical protein
VRGYLFDRLGGGFLAGKIAIDFDAAAFAALKNHTVLSDPSVRVDFTVSNGALLLLPGVPPLVGVEASGVVTGNTTSLTITRGAIEDMEITKLAPPTADVKRFEDNNATVAAFVAGQVQAIAGPQAEVPFLDDPTPCQQEILGAGLQQAQTLASEVFQLFLDPRRPAAAEFAPPHPQRRGGGELHQNPVADPERLLAAGGQPGFRRRIAAVVVKQRHQHAGVEVEASRRGFHGS